MKKGKIMSELSPFDIKSAKDIEKLSKEKIEELLTECEFYIEECKDYELSDTQIEQLEENIELLSNKLSGKEVDNNFENSSIDEILDETLKIAISSEFQDTMFPWFTLIRYQDKTKKKIVNTITEDRMSLESFMVSEGLDIKIQKNMGEISAFTLCYAGEVEVENENFNAILVELGIKGNDKSQYYYQRYTINENLSLIDPSPVKWIETPSRFKA
ncbi:hypothetical protein ACG1BZ_04920 [Microbulbifer sp. CNSA002]|uniref:hypothetical protein n=1 Tax=Microbulbifer sp. CNSA002 TaxID=3373604 RepID=UPI0039B6D3DE